LNGLAGMLRASGAVAAAAARYAESLARCHAIGDRFQAATALEGLVAVRTTQGAAAEAARLGGGAAALREALGTPLASPARRALASTIARIRDDLGEAAFAAAWAEGQALTLAGLAARVLPSLWD
jgi:hypothetical protein